VTIIDLLSTLRSRDVRLWADGDRLRYSAPQGALTPDLRAELVDRKGEILAFLHQARRATVSAPFPIVPVSRDGELALSYGQQRLWFLDQLEPDSPLYNVASAVRLTGALDVAALERSLNEIVRRHEVLRTTFPTVDGKPAQVIVPELAIPLPVADLSDRPHAHSDAYALGLATEEARRPFNLDQGPLIRVKLLNLSEEEHVVLLTMHHIVSDGWSTGVLVREMAALYEAFVRGRRSPLAELPIQYVDYAHWRREWLRGEVLESQMAYWRRQLAGTAGLLELPTDRPRPAVQSTRGRMRWFELPLTLHHDLVELSRREGVTLFMTLLAAFQTLLARTTGQEDICVGSPIANRRWAEVEGLIGFFVNTLVLRTDLSGKPSFREVLRRVRKVTLEAYAHQDLPFEMLVDELQPKRDLSHAPLSQVMFVLQNAPMQRLKLPGLTVSPLEVDSGTAKFDLALSVVEGEDGLSGTLEYSTDLFDGATIERMLGHFETLLEGVVADPDRPVWTLPLLTRVERHRQLVEWNDTECGYPHEHCVHELFEIQVERTPEAVAVMFEGEHLTYVELNRRANQLACALQKLGVGPEKLVGICVERSLEMIVGVLGVLKSGGAYVPLDPTYPQERLAFMLEDAGVTVLLTQADVVKHLPALGEDTRGKDTGGEGVPPYSILLLDTDWPTIAQGSGENVESAVTPDNLAYVIYTSGSTGRPKGVLLQHRGLCALATAYIQDFDVVLGSRVLQFFSFSFDGSVADFFMALLSGARLCMEGQDALLPGPNLARLMRDQAVTLAVMPPSALSVLPAEDLPALRTVLSGGESCTREIVDRWSPGRRFINAYGPTETTVAASWFPVEGLSQAATNIPIGRPMANTQLYVLDQHLNPVPVGVSGELHIGGVGVARGYLNRPGLTAERFTPDPFSDNQGARLYKTGDLVRYRPDGNIEFLGRIDHQVKVRGFRIELEEIEAVLSEHPAVRQAIALVREDAVTQLPDGQVGPSDKRLVAYIVPENEVAPNVSELRGFLKEKLPEYMVPSAFVTLDALPLTPVGKLDRRALPAPDQSRPDLESAYVAPRTPAERILADIWAEVLGVEQVGVHDSFFELGGDSILSIQAVARANQAGLSLTPRQLFQYPSVAGLTAVAGSVATTALIQAEQGVVEGPLPLTPIQCWFFDQELPQPHHWNQAVLLEVKERLEPELLEQAARHLLVHHDALRLRFRRGEAGWEQMNAGVDGEVPFSVVDLSQLTEAEQRAAIEARAAEHQADLDLTAGPLLRLAYFDLGADRPDRLLVVVHHLAVDGVSWRILLGDLQVAYGQLQGGEEAVLPSKTTSFRHWARRLAEYARSEPMRQELDHWLSLAKHPVVPLPVDFPSGSNTEADAQTVTVSLEAEETRTLLQEVPSAYGTEINDALLAALTQAFARWTGSPTLLVDLEGHGREPLFEDVDLSRTVGWFTTIFPVCLDLRRASGPGEALTTVKEQLRRVPGRGIGYGLLRYLCHDQEVVTRLEALPQAEVSFNYLGQFDQILDQASPFRLARESAGGSRSLQGRLGHLLSVNGGVADGRLQMEWTYSRRLYRRETVERVAEAFIQALRAIIAHCRSPEAVGYTPSDFPDAGLSQEEIDRLLVEVGEAV